MDICLLRRDFFDRPEILGLSCDYRVLLAATAVHPLRKCSGVLFFSPAAAALIGFDHGSAVAGLKMLEGQGLVVFDEKTLEVIPQDHFDVNTPSSSSFFGREGEKSARNIKSAKIKEARERLAHQAGTGIQVQSWAVPLNLISALPLPGKRLMASDAAIALALYCNPLISPSGTGTINPEVLAAWTAQTTAAATQGLKNVQARGIVDIDSRTSEYRIRRWFSIARKLEHENQQRDAVRAASEMRSRRLKKLVLEDIARQLSINKETLLDKYALKTVTCCTLHSTILNSTSLHSTSPHPTAPVTAEDGGDGEGIVVDQEKAKAMLAQGWAKESVMLAIKTARSCSNQSAADSLLGDLAETDPAKIKSPVQFFKYKKEQAEAGLVAAPQRRSNFKIDENGHRSESRFSGKTLREIEAIQKAEEADLAQQLIACP